MAEAHRFPNELARRAVLGGGLGLAVTGAFGLVGARSAFAEALGDAANATGTEHDAALSEAIRAEFGIEAPEPRIYSTSEWNARPPSSPVQVLDHRPTTIIVHHTATGNSTDYSQSAAFALARSIQNFHMDTRGWIDSGQQFTIGRGGHIMEGRHRSREVLRGGTRHVLGTHVANHNTYFLGIENQGTYTSVSPTSALWNSLVALCANMCTQYGISPSRIHGHRDYNSTECPGNVLYSRLPQLRQEVADLIGGDPGPGDPPSWPTLRNGSSGEAVRSLQHLLRQHGRSEITADGQFGPMTETAVRWFQQSNSLTVDGVVGTQTWTAIVVTVRNGSNGEAVRGAQRQLNRHGASLTVDGAFGPATESAVRSFQSAQRITSDGVVGPVTWRYLIGR